MNKKQKIYTGIGDDGNTVLFNGVKVSKADERVCLYGEMDELNCWLGLIKSLLHAKEKNIYNEIQLIQKNIFKISSLMACSEQGRSLKMLMDSDVYLLQTSIDNIDSKLPTLKEFIIPGQSTLEAYVNIARSVCRRVERKTVCFYQKNLQELANNGPILIYLNRLSDYLFVLGRFFTQIY